MAGPPRIDFPGALYHVIARGNGRADIFCTDHDRLRFLRKDPDQMRNVAAEAAYADVKQQLSARLMAVLERTGDPRLTDAFDNPPYVTDQGHAPGSRKKAKTKKGVKKQ